MPRMVGEKSSILPIAIGGIIIAAVAVAVWMATRGSQTEDVNSVGTPSGLVTPKSGVGATSDNEVAGGETGGSADNTATGAMGAENSMGAMGADNSVGTMGAENSMGGNTSSMGSAGANSMNGAASESATGSNATGATTPGAVPSPLTSSSNGASSSEKMTRSKTIAKPDGSKVTYSKSLGGATSNSVSKNGSNAVSSTR